MIEVAENKDVKLIRAGDPLFFGPFLSRKMEYHNAAHLNSLDRSVLRKERLFVIGDPCARFVDVEEKGYFGTLSETFPIDRVAILSWIERDDDGICVEKKAESVGEPVVRSGVGYVASAQFDSE